MRCASIKPTPAVCRLAAVLLCVCAVGGCGSPLLSIIGAAVGGGPSQKEAGAGPFSGAPSPNQNASPWNQAISEALAQAQNQHVSAACTARLPPPTPLPAVGCVVRPTCLPGSDAPIRIRLCAVEPDHAPPLSRYDRRNNWVWAEPPDAQAGISGATRRKAVANAAPATRK